MSRLLVALTLFAMAVGIGVWSWPRTTPIEPVASIPTVRPALTVTASTPAAAPAARIEAHRPRTESPIDVAAPRTTVHHNAAAAKVAMDLMTGQLTAPEHGEAVTIDEMMAAARQEAEGLVTVRNSDGSETLDHHGRFAEHSVVRVGADGRLVFVCVHGKAGVAHAVNPAALVPSAEDR
ncbi:MAG TPA: hypothetical protein VJY35_03465 [Candidatus Eisenbacteria bacterium]|nr:hypothetical protein [Candidatus Eisenbacteria bacterium]